jgi:pyruvate dehydrogenase E2 component (dihydrolipoamide acetyltransferase)
MPALSPTMTHGNLVKWHKKEGDQVKAGDTIAEIETDKATMEVEAVEEGLLVKILIPEGTDSVEVNQIIAFILEEGETWEEEKMASFISGAASSRASLSSHSPQKIQDQKDMTSFEAKTPPTKKEGRLLVTPLARRLAESKGIDLHTISGSGPHGRIIKEDIEQANQGSSPKGRDPKNQVWGEAEYEDIPLSGMRKVIAQRLTESKQTVPHFYLTVSCEIDQLLHVRQQLNEASSPKISVNDFVIRAVALALARVPEANAAWMGTAIRQYRHSHVAVAVAIEGGLITPIIKAAETKSLGEISAEMKELAQRAKEGKLMPHEYQGGSFSISNLGMYGVENFQAIINPPQGCILAVGAGVEKPVVRQGQIQIGTVMECTLSVDHRVVDGAVGARFLAELKKLLTNPILMLI